MIQSPDVLHHINAEHSLKSAHSAFLHGDLDVAAAHMRQVIDASLKFLKELRRYESEIETQRQRDLSHD